MVEQLQLLLTKIKAGGQILLDLVVLTGLFQLPIKEWN
jgi:hypothetical protein